MGDKNFYYTHSHDFSWSSDLVSNIWFNENTGELLVALNGGRTYKYAGYTLNAYVSFVKAPSAGQYYNQHIKTNRNVPSLGYSGYVRDLTISTIPVRSTAGTHEVTVTVTLTEKVRVTADSFGDAERLALDSIEKTYSNTDVIAVTDIEKL